MMRNTQLTRVVLEEKLKLAVTNLELWIYCIEPDEDMEKLFKDKKYTSMGLHLRSLLKCSRNKRINIRAHEARIETITSFAEEKAYGRSIPQRTAQLRKELEDSISTEETTPGKKCYDKKKKQSNFLHEYTYDELNECYIELS